MRRIVNKPFDWIAALFALPALGLMLLGLVNPRGFAAGLANADPPFIFVEGFLFVAGAALALVGVIWVLATWGRSSKATRVFGTAVVLLPVLAAAIFLPLPLHMYRRGLARWAATRVNAEAIRGWYAGGPKSAPPTADVPPFPGALLIDLADCPADISMTTPAHVWTSPAGRGVFLEWGTAATWSSTHHLFIGIDAKEPAPTEIGGWTRALPGVYVSDQ
jgi:hypothetical protein